MEFNVINTRDVKNTYDFRNAILKEVCTLTEDKCYKSELYNAGNVTEFKPISVKLNKNIIDTLNKITQFYNNLTHTRLHYLNNAKIEKEFDYMDSKSIHCVFISILTKYLLKREYGINLNLVQGYYKYENNPISSLLFGENSLGFHAWCELDGAVIDLTFNTQQSCSYNGFIETPNIIGVYNEDIELTGFVEKDVISDKYLNDFLRLNNLSLDEWLDMYVDFLKLR